MSTIQEYLESLTGKSIAVIGMGVSNTPLIRMLLRAELKVTVCDKSPRERVGELETEMIREFFYAVSYGAEMNLHLKQLEGSNCHHIIEGAFKAFAKALDEATRYDSRITDVLSTKGSL